MRTINTITGMFLLSLCTAACSEGVIAETPVSPAANTPIIQTNPPFIILNDNLDEKDKLGWCFDTKGWGFTEQLHAHSCKPAGDDVLFSYDDVSG